VHWRGFPSAFAAAFRADCSSSFRALPSAMDVAGSQFFCGTFRDRVSIGSGLGGPRRGRYGFFAAQRNQPPLFSAPSRRPQRLFAASGIIPVLARRCVSSKRCVCRRTFCCARSITRVGWSICPRFRALSTNSNAAKPAAFNFKFALNSPPGDFSPESGVLSVGVVSQTYARHFNRQRSSLAVADGEEDVRASRARTGSGCSRPPHRTVPALRLADQFRCRRTWPLPTTALARSSPGHPRSGEKEERGIFARLDFRAAPVTPAEVFDAELMSP